MHQNMTCQYTLKASFLLGFLPGFLLIALGSLLSYYAGYSLHQITVGDGTAYFTPTIMFGAGVGAFVVGLLSIVQKLQAIRLILSGQKVLSNAANAFEDIEAGRRMVEKS
ncbi:hypothetical protein HDU99_008597 [Rhizoclosmatium hyalinum]|nr:hypothetical protein HDU99_008597 [Rhizoclosmatium hyalinum]